MASTFVFIRIVSNAQCKLTRALQLTCPGGFVLHSCSLGMCRTPDPRGTLKLNFRPDCASDHPAGNYNPPPGFNYEWGGWDQNNAIQVGHICACNAASEQLHCSFCAAATPSAAVWVCSPVASASTSCFLHEAQLGQSLHDGIEGKATTCFIVLVELQVYGTPP